MSKRKSSATLVRQTATSDRQPAGSPNGLEQMIARAQHGEVNVTPERAVQMAGKLYSEGKIKPRISARYPLREGGKAIRALMTRSAQGKLVVTIE